MGDVVTFFFSFRAGPILESKSGDILALVTSISTTKKIFHSRGPPKINLLITVSTTDRESVEFAACRCNTNETEQKTERLLIKI